eukprot:scaffold98012_cov35-Prasinocladus_malaysianus.AAC.1
MRERVYDCTTAKEYAEREADRLQGLLEQQRSARARLESEVSELQGEHQHLRQQTAQLEARDAGLREDLTRQRKALEEATTTARAAREAVSYAEQRATAAQQEVLALQARCQQTQ